MGLLPHRRNLVIWDQSAKPDEGHGAWRTRPARARRIRRVVRMGSLLTLAGLVRLVRDVPARYRFLLAGVALTTAGVMSRNNAASLVYFPGILFLLSALLAPERPEVARQRHCEIERELAACSTLAQRRDLNATLDRYPDGATHELREILAGTWDDRSPISQA